MDGEQEAGEQLLPFLLEGQNLDRAGRMWGTPSILVMARTWLRMPDESLARFSPHLNNPSDQEERGRRNVPRKKYQPRYSEGQQRREI
jgi:hypothetical protein